MEWNYFITIFTAYRERFFGEIENDRMHLSETGQMANKFWNKIPEHFPFVLLDAFVVMPNHIHGIVIIDKRDGNANGNVDGDCNGDGYDDVETRHCLVSTDPNSPTGTIQQSQNSNNSVQDNPNQPHITPGQKRCQNEGKNTISSIIGSYKSIVTRHTRRIKPAFARQFRFYNHIIRNDQSYERIKKYIIENPKNWKHDRFY